MPKTVSDLQVMVTDPNDVRGEVAAIGKATNNTVRVYDWQQVNASFFNAVRSSAT